MRKETEVVLCLALILSLANLSVAQTAQGTGTPRQASEQAAVQKAPVKPRIIHHVLYTNNRYGFRFLLPTSWKGYSIIEQDWGSSGGSEASPEEDGPLILIRHPHWTEENPRGDIPIMIFTHKQWREVDSGEVSVSAAPFGPSEIGRNRRYVFALPPRFEYDFADGLKEVNKIFRNKPLRAFESANTRRPHPPQ